MTSVSKPGAKSILILLILFFCSCSNPLKLTKWVNKETPKNHISKILVVCIDGDSSIAARAFAETLFVDVLQKIGADAVSSLKEFGYKGLANLEQGQTYLKLCNNGIDAVLTIAMLDSKNPPVVDKEKDKSINSFYFNKIWSYKTLSKNTATPQTKNKSRVLLEVILFDLSTLSSVYWAKSKPVQPALIQQTTKDMSAIVQAHIKKLGVINSMSTESRNRELKAF